MTLEYQVEGQDGNTFTLNADTVMQHLGEGGYEIVGKSNDGNEITIKDGNGDVYTAPLDKMIGESYGTVKGVTPQGADDSQVNPWYRMGISALPNDAGVRKAYLQSKLAADHGMKDAQIVGQGDDYYVHNPETGKWMNLTNTSGLDVSDFAGFAPDASKMIGSTIGGIGGAIAGTGLLPGIGTAAVGAAGSMAGGQAGRLLNEVIGQTMDPQFNQALNSLSEEGQHSRNMDIGTQMALDGLLGGVAPMAAKALNAGLITPITKMLGKGAQVAGDIISPAAKFVKDSPLVKTTLQQFVPGLGEASGAGFALEVPSMLATGAAKGTRGLGKILGSEELANAGEGLLKQRGPTSGIDKAYGKFSNWIGEGTGIKPTSLTSPAGATSRDVLGNAGEALGSKLDQSAFKNWALENGIGAEEALQFGQKQAQEGGGQLASKLGNAGEKLGQGFENLRKLGVGVGKATDKVTDLGLDALNYGGKAASKGGEALYNVSRFAQPLENRLLAREGLEYGKDQLPGLAGKMDQYNKRNKRNPYGK